MSKHEKHEEVKQDTKAAETQAENKVAETKAPEAPKWKRKAVTRPLLKMENNKPYHVRFDSEFFVGKTIKDDAKKQPPTMVHVTNLDTGEEQDLIVPVVLKGTIDEHYPDNKYVGKMFEITREAPEGARKYNLFSVTELEEA